MNQPLSPQALATLAAGGTPTPAEIPADPIALTPAATQALLVLAQHVAEYGGDLALSSPYIVASAPSGLLPEHVAHWQRRVTQGLQVVAGVDLDSRGRADVDGWLVSAGGAS